MPPKDMVNIASALCDGGIRILEVTLNSADALASIKELSNAFGDSMLVGAGTVLNSTDAVNAIEAGAEFLISPSLDFEVIKIAKKAGKVSIPGAYTPTEILAAYNQGADIVKIFPVPDAGYIKSILAPLDKIRVMPTGGINAANIKSFADAGAVAFGISSALTDSKAIVSKDYLIGLTGKAKKLITALNS